MRVAYEQACIDLNAGNAAVRELVAKRIIEAARLGSAIQPSSRLVWDWKPVKGTPESGKIRLVQSRKIAKEKAKNSNATGRLLRPAMTAFRCLLVPAPGLAAGGSFSVDRGLGRGRGHLHLKGDAGRCGDH
jgi:hypothetical protein